MANYDVIVFLFQIASLGARTGIRDSIIESNLAIKLAKISTSVELQRPYHSYRVL